MLTVLCFKWFDPEFRNNAYYQYDARYVNNLSRMLDRHLSLPHELVCVTDNAAGIDGQVRVVPMPADVRALGTYYPKLMAFHPDAAELFGPRILLMDLDVVIVRNMDALAGRTRPFISWSTHPGNKAAFNTSMVLMDAGEFPEVWCRFDPVESPKLLAKEGYEDGDQDWVSRQLANEGATWARRGEGIEPFYQIRHSGLPDNASVVFFNGRRSPAMDECQAVPWVRENWR